jgi:hnRNP-L/PTB/hephaestus splicing factor
VTASHHHRHYCLYPTATYSHFTAVIQLPSTPPQLASFFLFFFLNWLSVFTKLSDPEMSSRNGPPSKRGRIDPNQTLSPREVEQELARENPAGASPNRIVLLTILNAHYPITVDIIHKICKSLGQVDRIVIFQKFYVQAMVEFRDLDAAMKAKKDLHGCDIYSGCCTIKMEYAKTDRLNVRQNDEKTWDFTTDFSVQHQSHDVGSAHRFPSTFVY